MKVVAHRTVFEDANPQSPTRIACFPGLIRISDGRLLSTFRVGSTKESPDETFRIAVSADEGQNWELTDFQSETSLEGVAGSLRIGHAIETRPGHLLMVMNWVDRSRPELPLVNPETGGLLPFKLVAARSFDNGRSWSRPREITSVPFEQAEISGPLLALAESGHFMLPMENQKGYHDPRPINERVAALISRDYGETWTEHVSIAHIEGRSHWCNRFARLPESGSLIGTSWSYDVASQQDLPIHLIRGSRDARQWQAPVSTGIRGQLSTLFPLSDSTSLLGYVHRHQPASIRLRAGRDGGRTWDAADELVVYAGEKAAPTDGLGGDIVAYYEWMNNYTFGWNPMVRLKNGNVLMVYFAGDPQCMSVRCAEIEVADLGG